MLIGFFALCMALWCVAALWCFFIFIGFIGSEVAAGVAEASGEGVCAIAARGVKTIAALMPRAASFFIMSNGSS